MKTKEELDVLKNEVKTLNAKLTELSEDELKEVVGSYYDWNDPPSVCPRCGKLYRDIHVC